MINKIKESSFLRGTLILLTGGFLSKLLGFFLKIIITRYLGTEGIGLYSLITPTFSLFVIISTFSFPLAVSKLTSSGKRSTKKVMLNCFIISILLNIISMIIVLIISSPLSIFLKEKDLKYPIMCIGFTLPFISLSSIVKGYYWGKQKMGIYIISNITEQIVRIIILTILVPIYIKESYIKAISLIILVNIISEISSTIVMIIGLPKRIRIAKDDIKPSIDNIKEITSITLPSTTSKIIGSIAHFLEPIMLTNLLSLKGLNMNYIVREYGIINGYAISLLILPQFFTQSISTSLIPEISKNYELNNKGICIKRINQIVILSLLIGTVSSLVLFINPKFFLNLIYGTEEGYKYIKVLAPFFLLFFIETPLSSSLQAMSKNKEAFIISTISSLLRLLVLSVLIILNTGIYSLIISIIVSIIFSSVMYIITTIKTLS